MYVTLCPSQPGLDLPVLGDDKPGVFVGGGEERGRGEGEGRGKL